MIWIMILSAMALLSIGHLLQFWDLVRAEIDLPHTLQPAKVSAQGLTWYSIFVSARVPFLFLFAQMDENDDKSYFRAIDGLQSVLIICLITMVYSPGLVGAPPLRPSQTVILLSLVFPLLSFFGLMNWLGRAPGYGRQLIGAITLYLLAKSLANAVANAIANAASIAHGNAPLLQEARNAPVMALVFETLPHLIFVMAALYPFRPTRPLLSGSQRETIRFLNPVCFMIASVGLAFGVGRYNKFLGCALVLLSVLLYVLRSAKWQSDFRRLKVEASAAEQARTDFLLDINHEIRSPLNSISLNASRLNREAGLSVDQAVMAKTLHKGAEFVISTLNDILDMSRMEVGALRVPLKPFDAGPVIGEVVELLGLQAEHRDIVIDWRATSGPLLLGDAKRLKQVLTNILANAIRYAPQHSKIVVEMKSVSWSDGPAGRITVTDFGEGIPQSKQELLFRRFSQLGENVAGSSGLGLAISSALMSAMSGTIAFESEPGRTCFWVELRQAGLEKRE
ncbi:MAG TPA: HAMP domain-containing sensor histidine kinase [Rhizomicrobium sp.]|nr:HAMP domain-containing sensor histidine kinase [Rhizomicrobium sp.]